MNETELAELERGIRAALGDFSLDWVLADIEEAIKAQGQVDVEVPRNRRAEDQLPILVEDEQRYAKPTSRYKGQIMVGNVPVAPADRVALMIEALRRLIVELPAIHEDAVSRLASSEDRDSVAYDMTFLPDEDDSAPRVPGIDTIKAAAGRRQEAEAFLARLSEEAMG